MKKLAAALTLCLAAVAACAAPGIRPSIVFVFIDDIGWGDLSCYGSPVTNKLGQSITPNLDRIAAEGIRFTQGYVASPICSPSRTGVLTGIEPTRYAIHSFLNDRANNAARNMADWVQPDTVSAPRLFLRAGYRTGQFGKWHMGGGRDVNSAPFPQDYGFEESLVAFEGMGDRVLYLGHSLSQQNADVPGSIEWVQWYEGAGRHTDAALNFITNAVVAGRPFYVHVPYNDTHSPYNVPPGQENDFDHITTDTDAKTFLGELHNLDKQIGRLAHTLDGLGVGTNTLLVIVGDNGAPNDAIESLLNRNGGLRGGKGNLYEGGIRELFLVRLPGTVPSGVVNSNTLVSTYDLLPTYCDFAGIPLPNAPFAGENMADVFRGSTRPRVKPLFWEYGAVSGLSPASPKLAVRHGGYKFMRNPDGSRRELFLLPADHAEATNVVALVEHASVVATLEAQLMTWYEQAVLGNVGEAFPCGSSNVTGTILTDNFAVTGGNSPGTGFAANSGVNFELPARLSGAPAPGLFGYRLGGTGGTSPRQPSDFSIQANRLTAAPRNGNGRFELSPDGSSALNFGPWLAGSTYEIALQMDIDLVGSAYAQRMSFGISDTANAAVGEVDLGVQIGTDGAGGLGVFERVDAASSAGGADLNVRITNGLPIGTPVDLRLRLADFAANLSDFNATYEILVNGAVVDTGTFRFNASATARYLIFDVAAHEGAVHYDNFQITVTSGGPGAVCRKPILGVCDYEPAQQRIRFHWTAQPGTVVVPEYTLDLAGWQPLTNTSGLPINVRTPQGTIQWLELTTPVPAAPKTFFRLRRE